MNPVKYFTILISIYLWIGFVCAISFMEAWLKFQAVGITLPIGLGIGRLVFHALNTMEWIFAVIIGGMLFSLKPKSAFYSNFLFYLPLILLIIQTGWILPELDTRAESIIQGLPVLPSNLHMYYVGMEIVKTICLFFFGISQFKKITS